ncbi:MAG: hypothetical protein A2163_11165 [Actinobacteria bacterium RBG_13_35_12]|nr:MAG: hypothetical protein A2163_11165 [Actinobacteria bacterium RBG_13_35_12]
MSFGSLNPPSSSLKMIDSRFRGNDMRRNRNDIKENGNDKKSMSPILPIDKKRKVIGYEFAIWYWFIYTT